MSFRVVLLVCALSRNQHTFALRGAVVFVLLDGMGVGLNSTAMRILFEGGRHLIGTLQMISGLLEEITCHSHANCMIAMDLRDSFIEPLMVSISLCGGWVIYNKDSVICSSISSASLSLYP